jgi:catechol 2,3-dioxygenase-like lactoylglutathione lyase family enzyme
MPTQSKSETPAAKLIIAFPQVFVRDVEISAAFYNAKLGFETNHIFGSPPFYALVGRGGAVLNLRRLDTPIFTEAARQRNDFLAANIVVENVKELFLEFQAAGVPLRQTLRRQPWGAEDFSVEDPDRNLLLFASLNDAK